MVRLCRLVRCPSRRRARLPTGRQHTPQRRLCPLLRARQLVVRLWRHPLLLLGRRRLILRFRGPRLLLRLWNARCCPSGGPVGRSASGDPRCCSRGFAGRSCPFGDVGWSSFGDATWSCSCFVFCTSCFCGSSTEAVCSVSGLRPSVQAGGLSLRAGRTAFNRPAGVLTPNWCHRGRSSCNKSPDTRSGGAARSGSPARVLPGTGTEKSARHALARAHQGVSGETPGRQPDAWRAGSSGADCCRAGRLFSEERCGRARVYAVSQVQQPDREANCSSHTYGAI